MSSAPTDVKADRMLLEDAAKAAGRKLPTCTDFDSDCKEIPDKLRCYLYEPCRGMCPYLRADAKIGATK